jgi:hypothetical protein
MNDGGAEEIRTPDPLLAKQMLYQLSYSPIYLDDVRVSLHNLCASSSLNIGTCKQIIHFASCHVGLLIDHKPLQLLNGFLRSHS